MDSAPLKKLLLDNDPAFWAQLKSLTRSARDFEELFLLSSLRKKAHARKLPPAKPPKEKIRLAVLGGYSLYPFHELVEHLCEVEKFPVELWQGDYDNYISEIMDDVSELYSFAPQVVFLLPAERRCTYTGKLTDPRELVQPEAQRAVHSVLELARKVNEKTGAEVITTYFRLPPLHDLGAFRSRTLASDWSFRQWVNLELGVAAPAYLHICDWEFLANRIGGIASRDERSWFESKQPCSYALMVELAREAVQLILSLK